MLKNTVWIAMEKAFRTTSRPLAERMVAALEAAQAEGGDIRGKQSAALLVVSGKASGKIWEDRLIDLRIEDHPEPVLEYARSRLTVFNPESFTAPKGGTEVPFYLTMLIPTIKCEVNGIGGDFLVDIGNSSGLVLNKPFIEKNELDKKLSS